MKGKLMSHFYYQVLKRIQSQLSAIQVFYLQTIQQLLYAWIVFSLFDLFKIVKNHSDPGRYFFDQLLIFFIARAISIYVRHRVYLLTPILTHGFQKSDRDLLIKEIEEALQKSVEFTKWSCGILSTVLVLVATIFADIGLKIADKAVSEQLLIEELKSMDIKFENILELFGVTVSIIVGLVLSYYFILQLFSFHKRLVLKVLKNCEYEKSYPLLNSTKWEIFCELSKEVLFLHMFKRLF
ncbi:hypothetical protein [Streptococcus pseudopneumoniae]|uniref:hypothetical protein n=2 Tax=Streptococcus pseudopneumoniae TaxID=257758 RepID=UPI00128D3CEA|nr:hypothetical protein [Streptococcus pseudopneumoniae]